MISKVTAVEWDIRLETLINDYHYQVAPICSLTIHFEDGNKMEFQIQIADKVTVVEEGPKDLPMELINKIIDRIYKPLQKEIDALMIKVEKITKYGDFEKDFWDKFWVENMMGK